MVSSAAYSGRPRHQILICKWTAIIHAESIWLWEI